MIDLRRLLKKYISYIIITKTVASVKLKKKKGQHKVHLKMLLHRFKIHKQ